MSSLGSRHPKVCQVTTASRPFDTRVFSRECRTLVQGGFEVVLITQHDGPAETVDGVRIVPLKRPPNRPTRMFVRPWRALWLALHQKAELYHIHDPELIPFGVLLRLLTGRPVIYGVREDYARLAHHKYYLPRAVRPLIGTAFGVVERTASRAFNAVVVVTADIASNFAGHRNTVLVRNYPVLPEKPLNSPLAKPAGHPFTMIYVGELTALRGVVAMVDAVERLASLIPCRLLLVGAFEDPELEADLRRRSPHTEFLGYLDIRENAHLFERADVGLCVLNPIRNYETSLPLKIFDYMMAGLPVIASNFPLWKEIVVGSGAGVCVDPMSADEIAEAAFQLSVNPEKTLEMGRRAQSAVKEEYNWKPEGERLVALYRELTNASRSKVGKIPVSAADCRISAQPWLQDSGVASPGQS